jgi:PPOX class probable F420-dependent enzyme
MDLDKARQFLQDHHRAVLATRRRSGDPQLSIVAAGVDDEGRVLISSRETAVKTKNLRRDPRASLLVMSDEFYGDWVQVDGTVEVVSLPDAMDLLIDYYRRVAGEHDDWDDYRAAMERDRRVVLRLTMERAGPDVSG